MGMTVLVSRSFSEDAGSSSSAAWQQNRTRRAISRTCPVSPLATCAAEPAANGQPERSIQEKAVSNSSRIP